MLDGETVNIFESGPRKHIIAQIFENPLAAIAK